MLIIKKTIQNFFKNFRYKIFKILYGNITGKTSHIDNLDIDLKKVQVGNNSYEIYYCSKSSLYTDTIHDTAIIKNNKIINGPSFQLRKNFNSDCLNNSVLKKGTPRLRRRVKGKVLSLIPLRNRRNTPDGDSLVTRITEGMTEYTYNGIVGYGMSEYLDQVVDGRPIGP